LPPRDGTIWEPREAKSSIVENIEIFYNRKRRYSCLGLVNHLRLNIDIIRKYTKMQHDFVSTKSTKDQILYYFIIIYEKVDTGTINPRAKTCALVCLNCARQGQKFTNISKQNQK
jgi:hypothetical protein